MDAFSPLKSSSNSTSASTSKFLSGLPSRGHFLSTVVSSNLGGLRVYICDHNTSPPEDQLIKTNQTNILIRSLMLKNRSKDAKGTSSCEASRKRPAERPADIRNSAKKPVTTAQVGSQHAAVKSGVPERNIQSLTVERLRALLKAKGLSLKGKKDELIARLQGASSQS